VRRLLLSQRPELAHLPLERVDAGWDNEIFRLGEAAAVRLPRRAAAADLIEHEQRWLPRLAPQLPLPVPVPQFEGQSGCGYPWRWSVVPWLPGAGADVMMPGVGQAFVWTKFLRALHVPAPDQAPRNPVRGVALGARAAAVESRMRRLERTTAMVSVAVRRAWEAGLAAGCAENHTWIHGDLHARNVLVEDGALSAVVDWGDLSAGDPATDLASVWTVFAESRARERVMQSYGAEPDTWSRARAWAILLAVMLADSGLRDNPRNAAAGAEILRRVCTGP
jgi:aminoglycoside phosphotransferase (APT) family kinase protein